MGAPQFQLKKSYLDPARWALDNGSTRPNVPTEGAVCSIQGAPSPGPGRIDIEVAADCRLTQKPPYTGFWLTSGRYLTKPIFPQNL